MSTGSIAAEGTTAAPPKGRKHLTERAKSERRLAAMLVGPAAIVMLAVVAYPVIDAFILSLERNDLRFPSATKFVGLSNYGHVLTAPVWWQDVAHTAIITVISVSIQLVLGMLLALAMHRAIFARGAIRAIALVPYGIVAVVAAYSWNYAWSLNSGWIPKLLGLTSDPLSNQTGSSRSSSPRSGRTRRSWRCCCWPAWRSFRTSCTRRRRSTEPRPGSASGGSRSR